MDAVLHTPVYVMKNGCKLLTSVITLFDQV